MANVADVKSKTIKITLTDGKERVIKFTLNALAELEEAYGSVEKAFDELEKNNSMRALRKILWAGFIHAEPDLTETQVGNLIDIAYMQELMTSLNMAFENDMVKAEPLTEGAAADGNTDPNA